MTTTTPVYPATITTPSGIRIDFRPRDRRQSKGRAYVWGAKVDLPTPQWGTRRGENPEVDAACDAYNRATIKAERALLNEVLDYLEANADEFGIQGIDHKGIRFNAKAGCSCGCSPGFILPQHLTFGDDPRRWDLYVDAEPLPTNETGDTTDA